MFARTGLGWLRGSRDPLRAALGRLERAVMEIVWQGRELSVREVQAQLARPMAYTTVMTTLDRLFKKGFVERRREGRAYVYTAALDQTATEATLTTGLLSGLLSNAHSARPFLSNLVDAVADRDDRLLDELEEIVRAKRETLKGESGS